MIVTKKRCVGDWIAYSGHNPAALRRGCTEAEAIGNLCISYPSLVGALVRDPEEQNNEDQYNIHRKGVKHGQHEG